MAHSSTFDVLGQREHADVDFAELAAAAGLLLVAVHALGVGLDRFAVGDFRLAGFDLDLVAALEPLAEDLQVQFAHAGDDHFLGLRIEVAAEGGVFLADLLQRAGELAFVAAALGADGQADHRRGERDRRHGQLAQRRAGVQFFDLGHGHDPARPDLVDRLGLLGLHLQQRGDLHALAHADHRHGRILLQRAREDADEIQLLHERVDAGLEHLGDQRAGRIGLHLDLFAGRVLRRAHDQRRAASAQSAKASSSSGKPDARLARHADDRNQRALGHGLDDQPARSPRRSAACPRNTAPSPPRRPR